MHLFDGKTFSIVKKCTENFCSFVYADNHIFFFSAFLPIFCAKYILLFYKNISNRSVKSARKTSIGLNKKLDKQKTENENHSQKDQSFVSKKADS